MLQSLKNIGKLNKTWRFWRNAKITLKPRFSVENIAPFSIVLRICQYFATNDDQKYGHKGDRVSASVGRLLNNINNNNSYLIFNYFHLIRCSIILMRVMYVQWHRQLKLYCTPNIWTYHYLQMKSGCDGFSGAGQILRFWVSILGGLLPNLDTSTKKWPRSSWFISGEPLWYKCELKLLLQFAICMLSLYRIHYTVL